MMKVFAASIVGLVLFGAGFWTGSKSLATEREVRSIADFESVYAYNLIFSRQLSNGDFVNESIATWGWLMFLKSGNFDEVGKEHCELFREILRTRFTRSSLSDFVRSKLDRVTKVEGPETQGNTAFFDSDKKLVSVIPGHSFVGANFIKGDLTSSRELIISAFVEYVF